MQKKGTRERKFISTLFHKREADGEKMVVGKFCSFNAKNGWIETISLRQIINFISQFEHAGQYKKDMCQQIK